MSTCFIVSNEAISIRQISCIHISRELSMLSSVCCLTLNLLLQLVNVAIIFLTRMNQ
jgi:hypothetical protein